jgi:WhiB family redox-sensing transcriptional regulator
MREPRHYEAPLCAEVGGDIWHSEDAVGYNKRQNNILAKSICQNCRHRTECAEWGIKNEAYGVWGGLTEIERKKIRRVRNAKTR